MDRATAVPLDGAETQETTAENVETLWAPLRAIAKAIYRETHDLGAEARQEFIEQVRRKRLVSLSLEHDAETFLREQMRMSRGAHVRADRMERSARTRAADSEETEAVYAISAWPLRSGREVRHATEEEIREQIEMHRANERGNRLAAEFFERVLAERRRKKIPAGSPCDARMSEGDFQRIYNEVYGANADS